MAQDQHVYTVNLPQKTLKMAQDQGASLQLSNHVGHCQSGPEQVYTVLTVTCMNNQRATSPL